MRKILSLALTLLLCGLVAHAQQPTTTTPAKDTGYVFTVTKELACTPVKNQNRSSTCWCFSTIAMLESELLRMGKGEYDLSEMFVVRHNFEEKAQRYVRMHGETAFSPGAGAENVLQLIKAYGIAPESVYNGMNYGDTAHVHNELDGVTAAYINTVIKGKKLTTAWLNGLKGILDAYLGKLPETFSYNGKSYTAQTFGQSLGLNMDDYVSITSFTHHPFYSKFVLEVPDNYFWAQSYNLPLDEMMSVIDNAVANGYTVAWGSDVSEKGFQYRKGYAVVVDEKANAEQGSDRARWEAASGSAKASEEAKPKEFSIPKELTITQALRQEAFDNYETQDDHGMLIMGTATDQKGNRYYKVKNSWGTDRSEYKGYFFASIPFVQYKTTGITVNKKAIPAAIAAKLGIK